MATMTSHRNVSHLLKLLLLLSLLFIVVQEFRHGFELYNGFPEGLREGKKCYGITADAN